MLIVATAVLFVAGLSWKWIAAGAATALPVLYLLITQVSLSPGAVDGLCRSQLRPARRRISIVAIADCRGLRRIHGRGVDGEQAKLFYLPEAHTDFIYAVISEELGFIGAIFVIGLFAVYGWARSARGLFRAG